MWRRRSLMVRCGHTILLLFYPISRACASCGAGLPRQYFAGMHPPSVLPLFPCMHLMWRRRSLMVRCGHASFFCSSHFPAHAPHVVRAFLGSTVRACILLLFYPFSCACASCGTGLPQRYGTCACTFCSPPFPAHTSHAPQTAGFFD